MKNDQSFDPTLYRRFEDDPYPEKKSSVPLFLFVILILVAAFFIIGTIIAFSTKKGSIGSQYRHEDPSPETVVNRSKGSNKVTTTKLGQLRISIKADEGQDASPLLIISPWFSYPAGDVQLFEEISQKDRQLKSIITSYFSSKTKKELMSTGEKKIKEELKNQIDNQLIMGDITAIYFDKYIFF